MKTGFFFSKEKKVDKVDKVDKVEEKNATVVNAGEDLFDDPDTRVNYDNFDLDGLFDTNADSQDKKNSIDEESANDLQDVLAGNYEELFDKYFSNARPEQKDRRTAFEEKDYNSEDEDFLSSEQGMIGREITDSLNSRDDFSSENEIQKTLKELSPEIKALFISNFLDKKDY